MKIYCACPGCDRPARIETPGPRNWQCPYCDHFLSLPAELPARVPSACIVCDNREFYKKKDFPHWLGLTILTMASLAFFTGQAFYHPWLAWTVLIGSAVLDGLLYAWVGDAVVCYRCGAHYRGFTAGAEHKPFELGIAERYRQERIRRVQVKTPKQ